VSIVSFTEVNSVLIAAISVSLSEISVRKPASTSTCCCNFELNCCFTVFNSLINKSIWLLLSITTCCNLCDSASTEFEFLRRLQLLHSYICTCPTQPLIPILSVRSRLSPFSKNRFLVAIALEQFASSYRYISEIHHEVIRYCHMNWPTRYSNFQFLLDALVDALLMLAPNSDIAQNDRSAARSVRHLLSVHSVPEPYAALDLSFQSQSSNPQLHVLSSLHTPFHLVISFSCRAPVAVSFCFITSSNSLLPFSNVLKASSIDAFPCSSTCIFSCMSSYLNFHSSAVTNISFNSRSTLSNFAPDASYSNNCSAFFCNSASILSNFMHLQRFWGASGDFWQAQWDKILDKFGDDPVTLWVYGSLVLTIAVYWIVGGIYIILDITNRPAVLRRYKIQPGTNEPVDKRELCKVIAQVLFNQIVVGLPIMYLGYYFMEWRGYPPVRELPTFHWVLAEIAIHILCEEIGFYYSHRFLHKRSLYKYIHKQHHEWTAPIAITALYCHPLENIGSNLLPPFLGVFIMGSHVATAWIWFSLAILSTLNAHSGYHLPFFPSPEAHDFHHLKFNQCYGVLGVLDRIHGTDTQFRNSRNYTRHIMMLSLIPPREAFPDEAKYKSK
ncbi:Uncharacterized protein C5orf4 like protein, partial [Cyphomyrmex costatus]